jgi:hypothetical protein
VSKASEKRLRLWARTIVAVKKVPAQSRRVERGCPPQNTNGNVCTWRAPGSSNNLHAVGSGTLVAAMANKSSLVYTPHKQRGITRINIGSGLVSCVRATTMYNQPDNNQFMNVPNLVHHSTLNLLPTPITTNSIPASFEQTQRVPTGHPGVFLCDVCGSRTN